MAGAVCLQLCAGWSTPVTINTRTGSLASRSRGSARPGAESRAAGGRADMAGLLGEANTGGARGPGGGGAARPRLGDERAEERDALADVVVGAVALGRQHADP